MSTATPIPTREDSSVVLYDVSWEEYCNILAGRGDHRFYHTYDNRVLEIMTVSRTHEWEKKLLGMLVEGIALATEVDICCLGSSTHQREDLLKGLEPDECYYIANEPVIRSKVENIDLQIDPPPDLVIEIDVSNSSIPRLPIYAALGVPELWRYAKRQVSIFSLDSDCKYQTVSNSTAFPFITADKLSEFMQESTSEADSRRVRRFVAWAVEQSEKG